MPTASHDLAGKYCAPTFSHDPRGFASLHLSFRGERDYLHSTDLFPALTTLAAARFSPGAYVESLIIRSPASHQVKACFDHQPRTFGSFRIRHGSDRIPGWLVETDEPVTARAPYDEATLMHAATSGPGFARFEKPIPGYTSIEQVVALAKVLATQLKPHPWWLCQMDLHSPLSVGSSLECRASQTVSNRFLTMQVFQSGRAIGSIAAMLDSMQTSVADTRRNR